MCHQLGPRVVAFAVVLFAVPVFAYPQKALDRSTLKGVDVRVRGCVKAGIDPGTVVLDHVSEVARDGTLLPQPKPGLPTAVYSFDNASKILPYLGRTVEVRGSIKDIRDSTIEIKPAPERNGELIAELPVEGPDVKATLDEVPLPVGTSGRNTSLRSVELRMTVDEVTQVAASCATR